MNSLTYVLLLLALLALVVDPGPRLRLPARIRSWLRSRRHGPGASAAARARQLRTPAVRLAEALGIPTRRGREAAQWEAGAAGERRTAVRLAALEREGWTVLHDRALPRGRANVDHLAISPRGRVYLPDTKRWSARRPLTVSDGRLLHGHRDVTSRLRGLRHEAQAVARALNIPVRPLAVMDGPPMPANGLVLDGLFIVRADRLCEELRRLDALLQAPHRGPAALAATADRLLPPYRQGRRR
ncbi:nuclease-related domain-containing protein [Streptomyces sp. ID05-04B]|uniref:nuclease-related domain-containing protein n=1 Tax=Streptomyces sp. ID05-04B TaxID=3028661 RepID=UPI0029C44077|nr:nuclease-related domain-containing protein [Streptomyces sp. ID05-04B]MDX5570258.1 nuclease-related domain-containing protein [Streptomyces sp. ID05-04B]